MIRISVSSELDGLITRLNNAPLGSPSQHEQPWGYKHFALVVVDIVRHIAKCFEVEEDVVWEWVDKERHHHTTDIVEAS